MGGASQKTSPNRVEISLINDALDVDFNDDMFLTLTPCVARSFLWLIRSSPEMSAIENSTPAFFESACMTIMMMLVQGIVENTC